MNHISRNTAQAHGVVGSGVTTSQDFSNEMGGKIDGEKDGILFA
tara:strand:- start:92 stop:223 length:132 start_codon:yes stop_codon:yes gene_type:complete